MLYVYSYQYTERLSDPWLAGAKVHFLTIIYKLLV